MGQGRARIANFSGLVQGKSEKAAWDLKAQAPSDVNITTLSGLVNLDWEGGGARVFMTSNQGSIATTGENFLKHAERDGKHIVEGLKSAKSMGQVFIRTESGPIRWRQ